MELLEHNDFLTSQSQKIREFYKYMAQEYPYLSFTFKGRIKSLIRAEGSLMDILWNTYTIIMKRMDHIRLCQNQGAFELFSRFDRVPYCDFQCHGVI